MEQDREYAISFKLDGILDEVRLDAAVLQEAKSKAMGYVNVGADEVVVKYYEDGDLKHQWDFIGTKSSPRWEQYE